MMPALSKDLQSSTLRRMHHLHWTSDSHCCNSFLFESILSVTRRDTIERTSGRML
ncbi:unnamed protein product [Schistosoma curassoni]|uniref:Uncharacterized protein n=1 Tax=Schistosoma curassoni TaxID=6186 RepID=A0A183KB16_9TREM|nr:unnamed protein product [Schistosoma curassoni]